MSVSISDINDYFFGYFQIRQIVSCIPGAGGIFLKIFGDNNKKYNGSSGYITYLIQGDYPKYGDGTSVTADLYLDFGRKRISIQYNSTQNCNQGM